MHAYKACSEHACPSSALLHMQEYPQGTAMILAGLAGGIFGATASHPFDTVKTRMQVINNNAL